MHIVRVYLAFLAPLLCYQGPLSLRDFEGPFSDFPATPAVSPTVRPKVR